MTTVLEATDGGGGRVAVRCGGADDVRVSPRRSASAPLSLLQSREFMPVPASLSHRQKRQEPPHEISPGTNIKKMRSLPRLPQRASISCGTAGSDTRYAAETNQRRDFVGSARGKTLCAAAALHLGWGTSEACAYRRRRRAPWLGLHPMFCRVSPAGGGPSAVALESPP